MTQVVTIVDTQEVHLTITHTPVQQVVLTDVAQLVPHHIVQQMPQHLPYVRNVHTVAHQWIHRIHIVTHVTLLVMTVDIQEVHLIAV